MRQIPAYAGMTVVNYLYIRYFLFSVLRTTLYHHNDPTIRSLDGLRGVAILLVLLFHCFEYLYLTGMGWMGVDLFFVLSGFLITRILLRTKSERGYFKNFYIKRTLRIFPLYYLFIIACLVLSLVFNLERLNPIRHYWGYFITYLQNFLFCSLNGFIPRFAMSHLWSLAVEEHFYLVWPLVVYFLPNKKLLYICIFTILLSTLLGVAIFMYNHSLITVYTFTFTRIGTIVLGSMLAILAVHKKEVLEQWALPVLIVSFLLITGFYIKVFFTENPEHYSFIFHPYTTIRNSYGAMFLVVAFFFAALLCIALSKSFVATIFSWQPLVFFGKYSYGIYMLHFPVYFILRGYIEVFLRSHAVHEMVLRLLTSLACTVVTVLLSLVVYHAFEKHFLKLKKKF